MKTTNIHRSVSLLSVVLAAASVAQANRSGPLPGKTGSPASGGTTCQACHGVTVGGGSVEILGAPTEYEADVVYDLIVRISDPDQSGAGFEISVEDAVGNHVGTLIRSDATNTRFAGDDPDFISHNSTGVNNAVANWDAMGDAAEYSLQWQAPSADMGSITFWAAGNAINDDFTQVGDRIYLTNVSATFAAPDDCPGDVDGDNMVNITDLGILLSNFGLADGATREQGDLTGDGAVNITDLGVLLANFGSDCP